MTAALLLLLLQVPVEPATVTETFEYYDVSGATADEVRRSIDRNRPKGDGPYGDGWTHWNVRWTYRFWNEGGRCRLTQVSTALTVRTTLPRWSSADEHPQLAARWRRYLRALREHEEGHAQNGRSALRAVGERLRALPPEADCRSLEGSVQAAADAVIAEHGARDRSWDARTEHGTKHGATFP